MRMINKIFNTMISVCAFGLGAMAFGQEPAVTAPSDTAGVLDTAASVSIDTAAVPDVATVDDSVAAAVPSAPSAPSPAPFVAAGGFTQEVIYSLFGEAGERDTTPVVRELPPFTGDHKVLISRPIYAAYDVETESKWVSAAAEVYTHYKVGAFPRTHAYTMDQVNEVMPFGWRDYKRKFNRPHFVEAAKKLGATHLIYQEYQPDSSGSGMMFAMELYWVAEEASVARVFERVEYDDFERGLDKCLAVIADAMYPLAKETEAFKQRLFPRERSFLVSFGNILAGEGIFDRDRSAATYAALSDIIRNNGGHIGVQYALAQLAARAGDHKRATDHINNVIANCRGDRPRSPAVDAKTPADTEASPPPSGDGTNDCGALQLILAVYQRGAGNREQEADALFNLFKIDHKAHGEKIKIAGRLYSDVGETEKAKSAYNLFLARNFVDRDISLALARLYFDERNCRHMDELLRWIDSIPEAAQMLEDCGFRVINASMTMKKTSGRVLALRISAGTLTAAAFGGGLYFNEKYKSEGKKYGNFAPEGEPPRGTDAENYGKVQKMRKNIDDAESMRNFLYILSGIGLAGFSITLLF